MGRPLGKGGFSEVRECIKRSNNEVFACKLVKKEGYQYVHELREEVNILSKMKHANITYLEDFMEDEEQFYVVMECIKGTVYKLHLLLFNLYSFFKTSFEYLHQVGSYSSEWCERRSTRRRMRGI